MPAKPKKTGFRKRRLDPVRIHLRKNDIVKVIAGSDRGKTGRVLEIDERTGKILVEHVGMIRRHTRPNPSKQIKGGIAERESPVAVSNVMIVNSKGDPTRIGHRVENLPGGKVRRTRICAKTGESLDKK